MKKISIIILVVIALSVLLLTGCSRNTSSQPNNNPSPASTGHHHNEGDNKMGHHDEHSNPTHSPMHSPMTENLTGKVINGVRVIDLTAQQFKFTPETIRAKKGQKVRIKAASKDVTHGFGLKAFKINEKIEPGKETVIEFTPNKAGKFHFHCTVYCGPGHGDMHGTFIVKE